MAQMNDAGFELLREVEGFIPDAYDDATEKPVKPGETAKGTLTIGYGHTGKDVKPGLKWTKERGEEELQKDVASVVAKITSMITARLNDNQFSAFVSFAFNIGTSRFKKSSPLNVANQGNLALVPSRMALYNKATIKDKTGKKKLVIVDGLRNRRTAEIALWNKPPRV
jgi:lysozyme